MVVQLLQFFCFEKFLDFNWALSNRTDFTNEELQENIFKLVYLWRVVSFAFVRNS